MSALGREAVSRGAHGLIFVVGLGLIVLVSIWLATTPGPPVDWHCPPPVPGALPCLDADAH